MKAELKYFIGFVFFWSTLLVGINFYTDPLQFYRKSTNPVFVKNQRYQIPGLIRNYDFNNMFVGTSHSENFLISEQDNLAGTQSLNLSISGSSAQEQYQVVRLGLQKKAVQQVIWEINYKSFSGENPNLLSGGSFPVYLYKTSLATSFYYLYSIDTLWLSIKNILGKGPKSLNGLNSWAKNTQDKFDGIHVVKHYCQRVSKVQKSKPLPNYEDNISKYILSVASKHPDVVFKLFFPPLSVFNFALPDQTEKYNAFRNSVYSLSSRYKNIVLYDFTLNIDKLSNPFLYKDIEHYSLGISNELIRMMNQFPNGIRPKDVTSETINFSSRVKKWKKKSNHCSNDEVKKLI